MSGLHAVMALAFVSSVLTPVLVLISFENNFCFHHNFVIDLCCPLSTSNIYLIYE